MGEFAKSSVEELALIMMGVKKISAGFEPYLAGSGSRRERVTWGKRSCAQAKIPVKSKFAAARFRRKTQEGMTDPDGPVQMDCHKPVRDF